MVAGTALAEGTGGTPGAATDSATAPVPDGSTTPESPGTADPSPPPAESAPPAAPPAAPPSVPPAGQPPQDAHVGDWPDLRVTASFSKAAYGPDEQLRITVEVSNAGAVPAAGVRVRYDPAPNGVRLDDPGWGELGTGVALAPGEKRTLQLTGKRFDDNAVPVRFSGDVVSDPAEDANPADNRFDIQANIDGPVGEVSGVVFHDVNGNGTPDPAEAIGRTEVLLEDNGHPARGFLAVTDEQGQYTVKDVPVGDYHVSLTARDWAVSAGTSRVTVKPGKNKDTHVRAVHPVFGTLSASMKLDRDTYQPGDTAKVQVTLVNRGTVDVVGVTAGCNGYGNPNGLKGDGAGWGALAHRGAGVTVPAGATITVDVSEAVPAEARRFGYVQASCGFTNGDDDRDWDELWAVARAKVPGASGGATGVLSYDDDKDGQATGDGVANTKLVLLDADTRKVVTRGYTDAAGKIAFGDVPAGRYDLYVVGPWQERDPEQVYELRGDEVTDWGYLWVVPGPNQPDPEGQAPTDPGAPAGPGGPAGSGSVPTRPAGLAATGADAVGLLVPALVALAAGVGLLVGTRRRRAAA